MMLSWIHDDDAPTHAAKYIQESFIRTWMKAPKAAYAAAKGNVVFLSSSQNWTIFFQHLFKHVSRWENSRFDGEQGILIHYAARRFAYFSLCRPCPSPKLCSQPVDKSAYNESHSLATNDLSSRLIVENKVHMCIHINECKYDVLLSPCLLLGVNLNKDVVHHLHPSSGFPDKSNHSTNYFSSFQ